MTVSEARSASLAELRADLIQSAARGQGPTFIAAKLDLLIAQAAQCQVCIAEGILPSKAIACAFHSEITIDELKADLAVARDAAGGSSRLHLALADFYSCVPSEDGLAELAAVKEDRARLDRVRDMLERVLAVANYEDEHETRDPDPEVKPPANTEGSRGVV